MYILKLYLIKNFILLIPHKACIQLLLNYVGLQIYLPFLTAFCYNFCNNKKILVIVQRPTTIVQIHLYKYIPMWKHRNYQHVVTVRDVSFDDSEHTLHFYILCASPVFLQLFCKFLLFYRYEGIAFVFYSSLAVVRSGSMRQSFTYIV